MQYITCRWYLRWRGKGTACSPGRTAGHAAGILIGLAFVCAQTLLVPASNMATGNTQGQNYDAKVYPICAPWMGARGDPFLRIFKPAFINGILSVTDDYDSLQDHLLDKDTGGAGPDTPGHPAGAAGNASIRSRRNRSNKLQSLIWRHVENAAIRTEINKAVARLQPAVDAHAADMAAHAVAAAAAVAAGAAAPPVPVPVMPHGVPITSSAGQLAWAVVESFGNQPTTGLTASERNSRWESLSMRHVGNNMESLISLKALIDQTNDERPVPDQFTEEDCRLKFLRMIDTPRQLVDIAIREMQQCSYLDPVTGLPSYTETANKLDELWRAYMKRGDIQQSQPTQRHSGPSGNRVDGMELSAHEMAELAFDAIGDGEEYQMFAVTPSGERVMLCWKCQGLGHQKRDCPSRRRFTLDESIAALQAARQQQGAGTGSSANSQQARARFMRGRKRGRGRGRGGRASTFQLECDENGQLFDEHGDVIGSVAEVATDKPPDATPSEPVEVQSSQVTVEEFGDFDMNSNMATSNPVTEGVFTSASLMNMLAAEEQEIAGNEPTTTETQDSLSTVIWPVIVTACYCAMRILARSSRAMMSVCQQLHVPIVTIMLTLIVQLAISSPIDTKGIQIDLSRRASDLIMNEMGSSMRGPYCNMDTGTTYVASGDRK